MSHVRWCEMGTQHPNVVSATACNNGLMLDVCKTQLSKIWGEHPDEAKRQEARLEMQRRGIYGGGGLNS